MPGIGKKTAQRLIVELKDRLQKTFGNVEIDSSTTSTGANSERQDAIQALESLGYKNTEATRVIRDLPNDLSSEELIRQGLRTLSGKVL